jgi:Flp pilus assembly protein TadG
MKKLKQKGQAIIEFAVVLPLFVLFLFGIIYSGMLFYDYISLSNLARSAAREAAIVQTLDSDQIGTMERYYSDKANNLLTSLYTPVPDTGKTYPFKIELKDNTSDDDKSVEVSVKMQRNVSSGLLEIFLPEDYTITYIMRREIQPTTG